MYLVKEIFYTLQGEGFNSGRPAVFCRFAGCNLWSGHEKDRSEAKCYFCDTDFVGIDEDGGRFKTAAELAERIAQQWSNVGGKRLVVFTGGEPLLQLDGDLITAVKAQGFEVAVETNGTIAAPPGIDWLTVSPKPNSELVQKSGSELKLVFPHEVHPEAVADLDFKHFFLSPLDAGDAAKTNANMQAAADYCLQHPQWRLTLQNHKILGLR